MTVRLQRGLYRFWNAGYSSLLLALLVPLLLLRRWVEWPLDGARLGWPQH
jgi:hypothetical protein